MEPYSAADSYNYFRKFGEPRWDELTPKQQDAYIRGIDRAADEQQ